ncbi:hypothetical protein AB1Y20_015692 [Prymnesium parvum]|uniref:Copper transporter n=1 Tax=Prymnesium parvum TaxID=97485 RepID=A0AB34K3Q8_PRYPA
MEGRRVELSELRLGGGEASSIWASLSPMEWISILAFMGTVCFCALQALLRPRRTFCAEQMSEPRRKRR